MKSPLCPIAFLEKKSGDAREEERRRRINKGPKGRRKALRTGCPAFFKEGRNFVRQRQGGGEALPRNREPKGRRRAL